MNMEDKIKECVQGTFEELHAPDSLRRKVMNMSSSNVAKKRMSVAKKLAVAAALAVVLFAGSNGVAYAMTGSTWVASVMAKINVDGVLQDVEMDVEVREDGLVLYHGTVEAEDGHEVGILIADDSVPEGAVVIVMETDTTVPLERTEVVVEENGNVSLVIGELTFDITEDMADGTAAGSYEKGGVTYQYEVKEEPGVPGCYELHISSEEE